MRELRRALINARAGTRDALQDRSPPPRESSMSNLRSVCPTRRCHDDPRQTFDGLAPAPNNGGISCRRCINFTEAGVPRPRAWFLKLSVCRTPEVDRLSVQLRFGSSSAGSVKPEYRESRPATSSKLMRRQVGKTRDSEIWRLQLGSAQLRSRDPG